VIFSPVIRRIKGRRANPIGRASLRAFPENELLIDNNENAVLRVSKGVDLVVKTQLNMTLALYKGALIIGTI
jgi:hypothetical protein